MTERRKPGLLERYRMRTSAPVTPRIHDDGDSRCLRFNDGVLQSAMQRSDPAALVLAYTRAMMGFLLFRPEPRRVLIIGLGGGSLSKFCYHALPEARITSVEIDPAVIALREEFGIPPDNERFQVVQADGSDYLQRDDVAADVILLDGYDAHGLPASLSSMNFYTRCRQVLGSAGVLAVNLWGGEPNRAVYLDRLRAVFDDRVWWCRPPESSSLIVFAVSNEPLTPHWSTLRLQARALDARLDLELASLIDDLAQRPDPGA